MTRVLKPEDQAADLPPDLAQLQAVAAAGDAAVADVGTLPGAEPPPDPEAERKRERDELAAMLTLGVKAGGRIEPALPKYYPPEACGEIVEAYLECAEKYKWTWHKNMAMGPEAKLGAAIIIPAFMVYQERRARLLAQAEAAQKLEQGNALAPAGIVEPEHV